MARRGSEMGTEQELRGLLREGIEAMRKRRAVVRSVSRLVEVKPEKAARGLIVLSVRERDGLRRLLEERFSFTVVREGDWKFRFHSPRRLPRRPEEKARWVDATVMLTGYVRGLDKMSQAYHQDSPDRHRAVVNAFADAYERTPVLYNSFASDFSPDQFVRDYASAMAAAWARSHYSPSWNPRAAFVLKSPNWASRLVAANAEAWKQMPPDAPIIRGTRFRDAEGMKDKLGRRSKIRLKDGDVEHDLINRLDHALSAEDVERREGVEYDDGYRKHIEGGDGARGTAQPPEIEQATFADEELGMREAREAWLKRARDARLPPRELELFAFFLENPNATKKQAADHFDISIHTVKSLERRYRRTLGA